VTAVDTPEVTVVSRQTERRLIGGLMGSSALGGLAQLIGLTGTALLVEDLLGSKTWIGTGAFAGQCGTALGATLLQRWLGQQHRRPPLVGGYIIGALGGLLVGAGARWGSYPIVILGMLLFGFGNTANQQSRFAAADVVSDRRRARAVSIVVWASTIGVVFGPKLWGPSGRFMTRFGFDELGGAFAVGGAVYVLAGILCSIILRPDPRDVSRQLRGETHTPNAHVDVRACLRRPAVRLALASLVVGQVVMVAVMSVTSVHLRDHSYHSGEIGTVISAHVFGMYAPSPVSGWLADRVGRVPVIVGGNLVMLGGCALAAGAEPTNHFAITAALLMLGVGWNGNFVAGSALVTEAVSSAERPRMQAVTDTMTFVASGSAALIAGFVLRWSDYPTMGVIGAAIAGISAVVAIAFRTAAHSGRVQTTPA
jgi:MFS family permease